MMILFKGVRVYVINERNESYLDKKKGLGVKVKNEKAHTNRKDTKRKGIRGL